MLLSLEVIMGEAKKGSFDGIPRLTRYDVACKGCGCIEAISLLEFLKGGDFEVGSQQQISVQYLSGIFWFDDQDTVTPILVKTKCRKCGLETKIMDPILTVEYLTHAAKDKEKIRFSV